MSTTDPALVDQARRGDAGAFAALVEGRWDGLVRLARSVVGEGEAEDAVQDGLLLAWQRLAALRDPGSFAARLTRVVLRTCLKRARWRRWKALVPLAAAPEPAAAAADRTPAWRWRSCSPGSPLANGPCCTSP